MKHTTVFAFPLWSLYVAKTVERDLNVNENEFFTHTCEPKAHLTTLGDSCIHLRCLKTLHP